ncbi:MAG TPA: hypothetical protein PK536_11365, partial [Ignavibacteria bacterium]|nr:hypothetical protein [Ignavibacteria bacterium]
KKFNDQKLRTQLSHLKKLCENFIAVVSAENNLIRYNILQLEFYGKKNMTKNFNAVNNELNGHFENEFNRNFDFYANYLSFERAVLSQKGKNIEKDIDWIYFGMSDNIDRYFISAKLELINSLLSRKYHFLGNIMPNIKFIDEVVTFIEENTTSFEKNDPLIFSEYLVLKMMTSENGDRFFSKLLAFVFKNINKYNHTELELVYFSLINFGFNKIAMGEKIYLKKIFNVYSTFESNGFYLHKQYFQDLDFISIIIIGLHLKEIAWVEKFKEKYFGKIHPEFRDDTNNLVSGFICYNKKEYDSAVEFLNKVNYQNSYYYLKSKETLIQIYYELSEFETLQYIIDSTRHYLKRKKNILSIHYSRYNNYLKYVGILLKARTKDVNEKAILLSELKNNINVIARDWLLEKAKEIK